METDYSFLKFFIEESIYIVPDKNLNAKETDIETEGTSKEAELEFYGQNKKNILILLQHAGEDLLKSADFQLLSKIMEAVNLTQHECVIVNFSTYPNLEIQKLEEEFSPKKVLVFGSFPELQADSKPMYEVSSKNNFQLLLADTLLEIGKDVEKKKKLWRVIRQFFG